METVAIPPSSRRYNRPDGTAGWVGCDHVFRRSYPGKAGASLYRQQQCLSLASEEPYIRPSRNKISCSMGAVEVQTGMQGERGMAAILSECDCGYFIERKSPSVAAKEGCKGGTQPATPADAANVSH